MTATAKATELSARTRHGRAVNAVAEFLRSSLTVPNIYLEPRRFSSPRIDLLAVDRAGAGDLHGVEIKVPNLFVTTLPNLRAYAAELKEYPTHYRYLALPKAEALLRHLPKLQLFSPDGIGRVGILLVSEQEDGLPMVEVALKPERYRVPAENMQRVDRFLARNRPDMEVRI
jgi:hypothetical protein